MKKKKTKKKMKKKKTKKMMKKHMKKETNRERRKKKNIETLETLETLGRRDRSQEKLETFLFNKMENIYSTYGTHEGVLSPSKFAITNLSTRWQTPHTRSEQGGVKNIALMKS